MSTPVSNTRGLDSVEAVVVVDTTTCLVAESSALECYRSSANACSFKTQSQEEEEEESSWEELVFDNAVMPDTMADAWVLDDRTDRTDRPVLDWSVGGCSDGFKLGGGVAFIGLPRRTNNDIRTWKKPCRELRTQLRVGCTKFASFRRVVDSLAIRCDEVTGLLLVLGLFRKWDYPEIAGLDDMIRNLIIPVVVEQRKEELMRLSQKYSRCLDGFPPRCRCHCCLDRRRLRRERKQLLLQEPRHTMRYQQPHTYTAHML